MKTGIYIGSFNPIHNGHITIAKYLIDNNYVDKVEFIPTGNYWDKQNLASLEDRINMINLAISNNKNIKVNIECSGLEYTYQVKEKLNNENYAWIMGADNVIALDKWKNFELLKNDSFIIINRNGIDIDYYMKKYDINNYAVVNDIDLDISSTMIKNNIEENKKMLDQNVYEYIKEHNLYGQNSDKYYDRMNSSINQKKVILDYVVGKNILDVGPGGGALLSLLSETYKDKTLYGIDNSEQVVNNLKEKYNVIKGDAININNYFNNLDTIIFSSILHEIYSYTGFSKENVIKAIKNAYDALNTGGRIIIRDGIMSEDCTRLIKFKNIEDIKILDRYCNDFKGRKITYEKVNNNTVKMTINDAMEFLYTYTWGEKSYKREVQEQFGYFTLEEYIDILNNLKGNLLVAKSYLQEGYKEHLLPKISIYDENKNTVSLPDSTCLLVLEKR